MVTLSAASDWPVTLDFATADGTATAGSDYAANGTLNFAPGDTAEPVTVLVNGDLVDESNETFFVNLSNPTNALIDDGLGVGTIIDDERNGSFSCRAPGVRVGGAESVVANPPDVPCRDDTKALGGVTLTSGLVSAQAVTLD